MSSLALRAWHVKTLFGSFLFLVSAAAAHAGVLDGCPSKNFQMADEHNITVNKDGSLTVRTRSDDRMRGRWGGQVRAEVNSQHWSHAGEAYEYQYSFVIDDGHCIGSVGHGHINRAGQLDIEVVDERKVSNLF